MNIFSMLFDSYGFPALATLSVGLGLVFIFAVSLKSIPDSLKIIEKAALVLAYFLVLVWTSGAYEAERRGDDNAVVSLTLVSAGLMCFIFSLLIFCSVGLKHKKDATSLDIDIDRIGKQRVKNKLLGGFSWMNWKDSIRGNIELSKQIPAYIGHHAMKIDNDRVLIRQSYISHKIRYFLAVYFFMPLIFSGVVLSALFILKRGYNFYIDVPHLYLLFGLLGLVVTYYWPSSAPLVFDRKHRLVYSYHRKAFYIAHWDNLAFSVRIGIGGRCLGIELYRYMGNDYWKPKWFTVASHCYSGEAGDPILYRSGALCINRWVSTRMWLLRYMEGGKKSVHSEVARHNFIDKRDLKVLSLDECDLLLNSWLDNGLTSKPSDSDLSTKLSAGAKKLLKRGPVIVIKN